MPLTISNKTAASVAASQLVNQLNGVLNTITQVLSNGFPTRPGNPAISVEELKEALGADNVRKLEGVRDLLAE